MQIKEIRPKQRNTVAPERRDEIFKKARKDHDKLVKGMFEFTDAQGGWLDFSYRFFKDEPLTTIRLTHGEICELPMGVVRHLRNTKKKIRKFVGDLTQVSRGVPNSVELVSRINFTPVDL